MTKNICIQHIIISSNAKKNTSRRIIIVLSFDENDIDDYDVIKLRQHS